MQSDTLFKGLIIGMEKLGAVFVKADDNYVYFDVKEGAEIDNEEKLKRAKEAFMRSYGRGVKIRKIK